MWSLSCGSSGKIQELVRGHHHLWVPGARATQQPRPWQRTAQPRGAAAVTPGELPTFAGLRAVRARSLDRKLQRPLLGKSRTLPSIPQSPVLSRLLDSTAYREEMPEQKSYKKRSASDGQKGCTVPSAGEAWRLEDDCMDPPGDAQLQPRLRTAVEDAPFSHFRTRSFYMRKSLSVDNHLGSLGYAVHPAETKAERVRTKLRRQFSLGSADKKDFYQPKSESSLSRFAHRLSVKQKQEKRRKAEYASAELSAFRPRSLSIECCATFLC